MNKKDLNIAKKFKSLASQKVNIHEIIIFGSRARDTDSEESDLDVLVVVEHLDHSIEKYISDCAWEVGFSEDVVIIPVTISFNKLKDTPIRESAFIKNVFREGIAV